MMILFRLESVAPFPPFCFLPFFVCLENVEIWGAALTPANMVVLVVSVTTVGLHVHVQCRC